MKSKIGDSLKKYRKGEIFTIHETAKVTRKMIEEDEGWRKISNYYRSNDKAEPIFKIMLSVVNAMYNQKRVVGVFNRKHFVKLILGDKNWKTPLENSPSLNSMASTYFNEFNFAKIDYLTSSKNRTIRIICLTNPMFLEIFEGLELDIPKQINEIIEFVTSPNYKKLGDKRFDESIIEAIKVKIIRGGKLTEKEIEYKEKFNHYFEQGIENDNSEF